MRAARIIANHPAERASVLGRWIWSKKEPVFGNCSVKLRLHDTGFDYRYPLIRIDLPDRIHVLRKIEHQCRIGGLSGQCGATATWQNGNAVLARQCNCAHHVLLMPGYYNAYRHEAIVGGVGRIQRACTGVEAHLAVNDARELVFKGIG